MGHLTVDELLDAHIKSLDLAVTLLTEKVSKTRKAEAIGVLKESLRASQELSAARQRVTEHLQ